MPATVMNSDVFLCMKKKASRVLKMQRFVDYVVHVFSQRYEQTRRCLLETCNLFLFRIVHFSVKELSCTFKLRADKPLKIYINSFITLLNSL